MARVQLVSLTCITPEDNAADEAYLVAISNRNPPPSTVRTVWGPESINNSQSRSLRHVAPIPFDTSAEIQLFDQDSGLPGDNDDYLGSVFPNSTQLNKGEQRDSFNGHGANYVLTWVVVP